MGANNSVPRTVVLINPNPNPKIAHDSKSQSLVNPEEVKDSKSQNRKRLQTLENTKGMKEANVVHNIPQTSIDREFQDNYQKFEGPHNVPNQQEEEEENKLEDLVLQTPTVQEVCADALISKQEFPQHEEYLQEAEKSFNQFPPEVQKKSLTDEEIKEAYGEHENLNNKKPFPSNKESDDIGIEPSLNLKTEDYEELIRRKSSEAEKYYFEKVTNEIQEIVGKATNWQDDYAKDLDDLQKDLMKCYSDNFGEILNCSKVAEEYATFIHRKRYERVIAAKEDANSNGNDAATSETMSNNVQES